ncbi:MAG TPA: hypothetical protein VEK74_03120 [Burkholderiaceae bacterium]|nr:hypothetical protein [Burkholderiaceae bacterium]
MNSFLMKYCIVVKNRLLSLPASSRSAAARVPIAARKPFALHGSAIGTRKNRQD